MILRPFTDEEKIAAALSNISMRCNFGNSTCPHPDGNRCCYFCELSVPFDSDDEVGTQCTRNSKHGNTKLKCKTYKGSRDNICDNKNMIIEFFNEPLEEKTRMAYNDNVLYIGKKPVMEYVLVIMGLLKEPGATTAVKARGRSISAAVDVVEITRNRFLNDLVVDQVIIGTDQLPNREGDGTRNVSTISIEVSRPE